jgi:metal-dependent amidase/aminoacylase/carboxypeptidase family protein
MDGYVSAYTMAGLMRQQLQASDRVHHVIKEDGQLVNVIPERAHSLWAVRALNRYAKDCRTPIAEDLSKLFVRDRRDIVLERLRTIIDAAAAGTNTSVEVEQYVSLIIHG